MKKAMLLLVSLALAAHAGAQGVSDEATAQAVTAFTTGQEAVQKNDSRRASPPWRRRSRSIPSCLSPTTGWGLAYVAKQDPIKAAEHLDAFSQKPEAHPTQVAHARGTSWSAPQRQEVPEAAPHLRSLSGKAGQRRPSPALATTLFKAKDEAGAEATRKGH